MITNGHPTLISRREAIRRGFCGAAGLLLADRLVAAPEPAKIKAKSVIQIFLSGGMSHNDTWDPKPDSGRDYMGDFRKAIPTNVPGIQLGEMFPELAKQADKFSLIRSMTHTSNGHETAVYWMQTGHAPGGRINYPSVGAVFTLFRSNTYKGIIPPYVVLTQPLVRFSEEGFLGPKFRPFASGGDPNALRFEVEGVVAPGISDDRQKARRQLLDKANTMGKAWAASPVIAEAEETKNAAYELILGSGRQVFDLSKEKPELRERYGRTAFGQSCLAARRLVEAGVPYVSINFPEGWDTHNRDFGRMALLCPKLDKGLATLLADLKDHGLLDSTLVWCCGEFGRTPKVDWQAPWFGGRGHYCNVFTVLVAGAGFKGGCVVGSSDAKAEEVKERPVYPVDLIGSIYHLAGIDPNAMLPHPMGLEAHVLAAAAEGQKSAGLLTEIM